MEEDQVYLSLQNLDLEDHESVKEIEPPLPSLEEVEEITGYSFRKKELLKEAFTHASYKADDCQSYERLEYLGDSVLNHLIAKLHYFQYSDMAPGELTRLRAANVDTEALARAALKHGLHKFLRHRKPLLDGQVVECLLQPLLTPENMTLHPVAKFHEACQKIRFKPQVIDLWTKTGEFEIYINNEFIGRGKYKLKKMIVVNIAADDAYNNLFGKLGKIDGGTGG